MFGRENETNCLIFCEMTCNFFKFVCYNDKYFQWQGKIHSLIH